MSWQKINCSILENDHVLLRPISAADRDPIHEIAFDPGIWRYFVTRIESEPDFEKFMLEAIDDTAACKRVAFCVISKPDLRTAGVMCYGNLSESEKRLEIGWSWLGQQYRGSGLNRWAKYLLLKHAFEVLGCERVEFKTDVLNLQARKGLEKIGATLEGIFRSYNYMPDNRRRDAVYYSIIKSEWLSIEERLLTDGHPWARCEQTPLQRNEGALTCGVTNECH